MKLRSFLLACGCVLGLSAPVGAQYVAPGTIKPGTVIGHCTVSITTVQALSAACTVPKNTTWAWIENEGAAFRWWSDGTVPTTTTGMAGPAGSTASPSYVAVNQNVGGTQIVAQSGTTVLNIEFVQ